MNDQAGPTLFDYAAEQAARDRAMANVEHGADGEWLERARAAIVQVAQTQADLISDDVWRTGLEKPREARALGPIVKWAARAGYIQATSTMRPSAQTGCHAMPRRVWRSLVFKADDD